MSLLDHTANTPSSPKGTPSQRPSLARGESSERGEARRASISASTTRSGSSSRSTSFNLPTDDLGRTEFRQGGLGLVRGEGAEVVDDDDEDLDEESEFYFSFLWLLYWRQWDATIEGKEILTLTIHSRQEKSRVP